MKIEPRVKPFRSGMYCDHPSVIMSKADFDEIAEAVEYFKKEADRLKIGFNEGREITIERLPNDEYRVTFEFIVPEATFNDIFNSDEPAHS